MTSARTVLVAPRRVIASAIALMVTFIVLAAASRPAWALCPNCLGQARTLTPTLELLGAFLLVPFVIAYVLFRVIRRISR